jgi:hypothetical protein
MAWIPFRELLLAVATTPALLLPLLALLGLLLLSLAGLAWPWRALLSGLLVALASLLYSPLALTAWLTSQLPRPRHHHPRRTPARRRPREPHLHLRRHAPNRPAAPGSRRVAPAHRRRLLRPHHLGERQPDHRLDPPAPPRLHPRAANH